MSGVQCAFHRFHVLLSNEVGQVPENRHLFNTDDHQTYVRPLPDQQNHMPDGMFIDDCDAFRQWHAKLTCEGYVFDFWRELLEHCKLDILLLKQGCITFKREFEAKARFDPFEQMTIASACNRYLRTHCLQSNTITCEPLLGWSTCQPVASGLRMVGLGSPSCVHAHSTCAQWG